MSEISIHHTHTQEFQDAAKSGWEFSCPYCSYRTRYITRNGNGPRRLEIIDRGDPHARHTSAFPEDSFDIDWVQQEPTHKETSTSNDDVQLPEHLQQQIEEILKRIDTDS